MITLIAAAALAAQDPAVPAQAAPAMADHAQHQQGKPSEKGMDCCNDCCKDMAKMHEGHDKGMSDHQQHPAQ